jgi:hypothetical protein
MQAWDTSYLQAVFMMGWILPQYLQVHRGSTLDLRALQPRSTASTPVCRATPAQRGSVLDSSCCCQSPCRDTTDCGLGHLAQVEACCISDVMTCATCRSPPVSIAIISDENLCACNRVIPAESSMSASVLCFFCLLLPTSTCWEQLHNCASLLTTTFQLLCA